MPQTKLILPNRRDLFSKSKLGSVTSYKLLNKKRILKFTVLIFYVGMWVWWAVGWGKKKNKDFNITNNLNERFKGRKHTNEIYSIYFANSQIRSCSSPKALFPSWKHLTIIWVSSLMIWFHYTQHKQFEQNARKESKNIYHITNP